MHLSFNTSDACALGAFSMSAELVVQTGSKFKKIVLSFKSKLYHDSSRMSQRKCLVFLYFYLLA